MVRTIFPVTLLSLVLLASCGGEGKSEEAVLQEEEKQKQEWNEKKEFFQSEFTKRNKDKINELSNVILKTLEFVESDEDTSLVIYKLDDPPICEYDRSRYDSPDDFLSKKNCIVLSYENLKENGEENTARFYDENKVRLMARLLKNEFAFDEDLKNRDLELLEQMLYSKYILISIQKEKKSPRVLSGEGGEIETGYVWGLMYLIDIESGGMIARVTVEAENSVEGTYESSSESLQAALEKDLLDNWVKYIYEVMRIGYPLDLP